MLMPTIQALALQKDGTYVDLTFGGGGHARLILEQLGPKGRLIAFDQDPASAQEAIKIKDKRFTFVRANFRFLTQFLAFHKITHVEGILADLGISSYQLDTAERGFANRIDGPLDMRMNLDNPHSAAYIIERYSQGQLAYILTHYGEVPNGKRLAAQIVRARRIAPITTTTQLKNIAMLLAPKKYPNKYFAKVFQAFRIAVNDELGALESMLLQVPKVLKRSGRLVVLAYHALEDRLVKNMIKTGNLAGHSEKDFYGNLLAPLQPLHRKVIKPTQKEIAHNNRARSARLRVATKV